MHFWVFTVRTHLAISLLGSTVPKKIGLNWKKKIIKNTLVTFTLQNCRFTILHATFINGNDLENLNEDKKPKNTKIVKYND